MTHLSEHDEESAAETHQPPPDLPIEKEQSEVATFWLLKRDQIFLAVVSLIAIVLLSMYALRLSRFGTTPIEIEHHAAKSYEFRVDVNHATWVEWSQLEGVGRKLAERIVEHRETHGPFQTIEDVQLVKGIGPKKFERLKHWLVIEKPFTTTKK